MTRKLVFLFVVLSLAFFTLISLFLGERGIIVNNRIKRQLKINEYELDRKNVEIETLKLQDKELETEDAVRAGSMGLGYKESDDEVYILSTQGEEAATVISSSGSKAPENAEIDDFVPWKTSFIILISLCASFIITLLFAIFHRHKGQVDDSQQEESGNTGDDIEYNQ